jgi:hypothetical protein
MLAMRGEHVAIAGKVKFFNETKGFGPGPHRIPGITTLCDNSTVVGAMTVAKLDQLWAGIPIAARAGK